MKKILAALLLLAAPVCAQTISPSQIKPGTNGQVMQTVGGQAVWASTPGGTVTSVGLSAPSFFSVANSPVTSSGTLALGFGSAPASTVPVGTGSGVVVRQLTMDDIAPAFAISSFTCSTCGTYEVGYSVPSPTNFTAGYTSTPASASVSDGTHTATLSTPFTSGSLTYSYTANTTFTLTAAGATTKTATQSIGFLYRTFGGVGAGGATGATASGTNATLVGAAGTLNSVGLGDQGIYGPFNPSGQKVYLLMLGNSHTFKDASTGFAFPFLTPTAITFTNQYGAAVTMYLYESTNLIASGTSLTLQVVS